MYGFESCYRGEVVANLRCRDHMLFITDSTNRHRNARTKDTSVRFDWTHSDTILEYAGGATLQSAEPQ